MQPKVDVPVPTDGAKVLMVKFNDYQCPPCRQTYEAYGPLLEKWAKTGQVQVRAEALPARCRVQRRRARRPASGGLRGGGRGRHGAREERRIGRKAGALAVRHQGPPLLTPERGQGTRREDVAGITDFDAKYASTLIEVRNDAGMGVMLGVKSTPTFFINGHMLPGGQDPRLIDAVIDLEMRRRRQVMRAR